MTILDPFRKAARGIARDATNKTEISPEDALARAQEHTIAATRALAKFPDREDDGPGHASGIVAWHAHLKSAAHYLEHVRRDVGGLLSGDDDDDAEIAEGDVEDNPQAREARSIRESTRAHAATVLLASGDAAGAKKLLRTTPKGRR